MEDFYSLMRIEVCFGSVGSHHPRSRRRKAAPAAPRLLDPVPSYQILRTCERSDCCRFRRAVNIKSRLIGRLKAGWWEWWQVSGLKEDTSVHVTRLKLATSVGYDFEGRILVIYGLLPFVDISV